MYKILGGRLIHVGVKTIGEPSALGWPKGGHSHLIEVFDCSCYGNHKRVLIFLQNQLDNKILIRQMYFAVYIYSLFVFLTCPFDSDTTHLTV